MTSQTVFSLLGLTAVVAVLCGVLAFALSQFVWSSREARGIGTGGKRDTSLVMSAVAEALARSGVAGAGGRPDSADAAWYRELTALVADETRRVATELRRSDAGALADAAGAERHRERRACGAELAELEALAGAASRLITHDRRDLVVDVSTVIERVVADARRVARQRGGDLIVEGTFPSIPCDVPLLTGAFAALVRRALAACESSGVAPIVVITGRAGGDRDQAGITVADNGAEPEAIGPGPLVDASASVARQFGDLERLLIERIARQHHGTIVVGASPMGGTLVEVTLAGPAQS